MQPTSRDLGPSLVYIPPALGQMTKRRAARTSVRFVIQPVCWLAFTRVLRFLVVGYLGKEFSLPGWSGGGKRRRLRLLVASC